MGGNPRMSKAPRVLIVDDVPENLSILHHILSEDEYSFSVATDGAETLEILKKQIPDLILLDIMLPDIDGYEICRRIKADPATEDIPVIFLSGKTQPEDKIRGFLVGGVDYITKPYDAFEIQARVKAHVSLKQAQDELREANEAKRKMFSIIAHDLMGPMSGLSSFLELMENESNELSADKLRSYASDAVDSVRNVSRLLENLLTWSQTQIEGFELRPENLDLGVNAAEAVRLLTPISRHKGIVIENAIPAGTSAFADKDSVDAILRNLVSNAIKFSNRGGRIRLFSSRDRPGFIEVTVEDTGIGMTADRLQALFGASTPARTYGTNRERGIGLGLKLVREFVESNGGKLSIESEAGKGSRISFTLPETEAHP
jgi:two-component system, sensor histidine kinase and response regulator